jgi:hypothetical protein
MAAVDIATAMAAFRTEANITKIPLSIWERQLTGKQNHERESVVNTFLTTAQRRFIGMVAVKLSENLTQSKGWVRAVPKWDGPF